MSSLKEKEEISINKQLSDLAWKFNNLNSNAKVLLGNNNYKNVPFIPISELINQKSSSNLNKEIYKRAPKVEVVKDERENISAFQNKNLFATPLQNEYSPSNFKEETYQPKFEEYKINREYIAQKPIETPVSNFYENVSIPENPQQDETDYYQNFISEEPKNKRKSFLKTTVLPLTLVAALFATGYFGFKYLTKEDSNFLNGGNKDELLTEDELDKKINDELNTNISNELNKNKVATTSKEDYYQPKFENKTTEKKASGKLNYAIPSRKSIYSKPTTTAVKQPKIYKAPTTPKVSAKSTYKQAPYKTINQKSTAPIVKTPPQKVVVINKDKDPSMYYDSSSNKAIPKEVFSTENFPIEISYIKGSPQVYAKIETPTNNVKIEKTPIKQQSEAEILRQLNEQENLKNKNLSNRLSDEEMNLNLLNKFNQENSVKLSPNN